MCELEHREFAFDQKKKESGCDFMRTNTTCALYKLTNMSIAFPQVIKERSHLNETETKEKKPPDSTG